jgi:hypothetical protein
MAKPAEPEARSRNKKGVLLPGYSKVTVQTSQLEQKKEILVGGCQTLADLHELIWDEFGHLLKKIRVKDTVVLVWASDEAPGSSSGKASRQQQSLARWMKVTEASDMSSVVQCTAIKVRDKKALDHKALAVAFAPLLTGKKGKKSKKDQKDQKEKEGQNGKAKKRALKHKEEEQGDVEKADGDEDSGEEEADAEDEEKEEEEQSSDVNGSDEEEADGNDTEESEEADGGAAAALGQRTKGGFSRLAAESPPGEASSDDDNTEEPLCSDVPVPRSNESSNVRSSSCRTSSGKSPGKLGNRGHREKKAAKPDKAKAEKAEKGSAKKGKAATRAPATRDDDEEDLEAADAARSLVGKRVEVHGLVGQAELNGRKGQVTMFDEAKSRFRVRLETHPTKGASKLLAFKLDNLRRL